MLRYAIIFFVVAIIAGILGFGGIAGASSQIAVLLFWVFIVLFVLGPDRPSLRWARPVVVEVSAVDALTGPGRQQRRRRGQAATG
jgi:uncharacterized membrane protein YtjA (UPF0391 family)